jgi:hypothetical protein
LLVSGDVLLLCIAEGPNLITLNPLTGQLDQYALLIVLARSSDLRQELEDGIESYFAHTGRTAKGVSLD